jgi:hypothetical protein
MKLEDFKQLLENHDWYYGFSDDHSYWVRGERQSAEIYAALKNGTVEMKQLYNRYHANYFNMPSFVTPDNPYIPPYNV